MASENFPDYLDSNVFEVGEFEETRRRLSELVEAFGQLLVEPIEQALSAQLAEQTGDPDWIAFQARWKAVWGAEEVLIEAANVRGEATSSSRELSYRVLACWLDVLTRAGNSPEAVALNEHLLPDALHAEEVLRALPAAAYGLELSQVARAFHQFVEALLAEAAGSHSIELGPRLVILTEAAGRHCFIRRVY